MKALLCWRGKFRMCWFLCLLGIYIFSGCQAIPQPEPPTPGTQPIQSAFSPPETVPPLPQQPDTAPITLMIEPWIFNHKNADLPTVYFKAEHLSVDKLQFDPANPEDLKTWHPNIPGNENFPQPQTMVGEFRINQDLPSMVSQGRIVIDLAEPVEQNLQHILKTYKVWNYRLIGDLTYSISPDMTTIDLSKLTENIRILNSRVEPEQYLREARFMNLESAKTFALVVELLVDERVSNANFNRVLVHPDAPRLPYY